MKCSIGMKVKIKNNSKYYTKDPSNPGGVVGTIISINWDNKSYEGEPFPYRVDWGRGHYNTYRPGDIEKACGI